MAERPSTRTQTTANRQDGARSSGAVIAVILGALAVITAFIPGLFWLAWILGGVGIALALPAMRQGSAAPSFSMARTAVIAGVIALVIGIINLGIVLEWFTFFTTDKDTLRSTTAFH
jgi:hypothetical protein